MPAKLPTGLYRRAGSPTLYCGFSERGRKVSESTGTTSLPEAKRYLYARRQEVARQVEEGLTSSKRGYPFINAANRYLDKSLPQLAPRHARGTAAYIARLVARFQDTPVHEITEPVVIALLAERQGSDGISNATLNRGVLAPLRRILKLAKKDGHRVAEIEWAELKRKERGFIKREVMSHEIDNLMRIPEPYRAIVEFARLSGLRQSNLLLRKNQVDLVDRGPADRGTLTVIGKGGKVLSKTISPAQEEVLREAMANPTEWVFAFERGGAWHPVTQSGLQSAWHRARKAGYVAGDLRFHDLRHDFATKLLRSGANLLEVRDALDHTDVKITQRYAFVLREEVNTAVARLQREPRPASAEVVTLADRRVA